MSYVGNSPFELQQELDYRYEPIGRSFTKDLARQLCRAAMTANQSISANTWAKVLFDIAPLNPSGLFNAAGNNVLPKVPGWYRVSAQIYYVDGDATLSAIYCEVRVYRSGVSQAQNLSSAGPALSGGLVGHHAVAGLVYCNGVNDVIEVWGYREGGGAACKISPGSNLCLELVGAEA